MTVANATGAPSSGKIELSVAGAGRRTVQFAATAERATVDADVPMARTSNCGMSSPPRFTN